MRSRSWRSESLAAPPGQKTGSKLAFLNGGGALITPGGTCLGVLQVPAPPRYFTKLKHAGPRGAARTQCVHTVKVAWMNGWMEPFTAAGGWRMPVEEKEPGNIQALAVRVRTGCRGQEKYQRNLFQIQYSFQSTAANYSTDSTRDVYIHWLLIHCWLGL